MASLDLISHASLARQVGRFYSQGFKDRQVVVVVLLTVIQSHLGWGFRSARDLI